METMFKFHTILVLLISIYFIKGDPCNNYTILDSENDYIRSAPNDYGSLCDNLLVAGWYRISSKAEERIPTECIYGGFRCVTTFPIWMNGLLPVPVVISTISTPVASSTSNKTVSLTTQLQQQSASTMTSYINIVSSTTQLQQSASTTTSPINIVSSTAQFQQQSASTTTSPINIVSSTAQSQQQLASTITGSINKVSSSTQSQQNLESITASYNNSAFSRTQSQQQSASTIAASSLPLVSEITETSTSTTSGIDLLLPVKYDDSDNLVTIITSVVASISTSCLLIIFIVWISRRKSSKNANSEIEAPDQCFDPPTYAESVRKDTNLHVYVDMSKYGNILKEETEYDEIPESTPKLQ